MTAVWAPRPTEDDASLTVRAAAGDEDAFALLYHRHYTVVERVCRNHGPVGAASDLAHDVFVKLLRQGPLERPDLVRHWLLRVARNTAINAAQRHAAVREKPVERIHEHSLVTDDQADAVVDRLTTSAVLSRLGTRDATLLRDHYLHDLPLSRVAERAGSTPGAVKVGLHRARQRAREIALSSGLRAGLPWPLAHRLRIWMREFLRVDPQAAASLLMPAVIVAAVTAGVAFDALAPAQPGQTVVLQTTSAAATAPSSSEVVERAPSAASLATSAQASTSRSAPPVDPPAAATGGRRKAETVVPAVSAPLVGPVTTSAPDKPPSWEFGVRGKVAGHSGEAFRYEHYKEQNRGPTRHVAPVVADVGCEAFDAAPDPAYCDR